MTKANDELSERLRMHVNVLAEIIGERNTSHPTAFEATRAYLRRELASYGATVDEQTFKTIGRSGLNLEVRLAGRDERKPALLIGAHYDSAIGTPGADDNASAVAILLELVRASFARQRPAKREIRFVFFDCEEPPHFNLNLMGSTAHARACRARGERLFGMICLESLGYFVRTPQPQDNWPWPLRAFNRVFGGRHVVIVSDLRSIAFGLRFVWTFATSGWFYFVPAALPVFLAPVISLSDHRSYWQAGYRALMITDTAILRNPNYHMPTDRLETLDLNRMTKLCAQLIRCVARMAS